MAGMSKSPAANPPSLDRRRKTPAVELPPLLRSFLMHLATERGLADNTQHAYRRDLTDLHVFLSALGRSFTDASADEYRHYLQGQTRKGQSTKTVARRLAAIRVFLRFLAGEKYNTAPILQQLDRPKPEHDLPKILSRSQVNTLIGAPDPESPLFTRDVAIL